MFIFQITHITKKGPSMSPMLITASVAITGALALYTAGVFRERRKGILDGKALTLFWLGLACDSTGTTLMSLMARSSAASAPAIHGVTGAAAIVLMLFHAGWATLVWLRSRKTNVAEAGGLRTPNSAASRLNAHGSGLSETEARNAAATRQRTFHRFSTSVWLAWLVPYVIGLLVGIPAIHLRSICAVGTSLIVVALVAMAVRGVKPARPYAA